MISKNPNPTEGFYLDPNGIALPGLEPFAASPATTPTWSDDSSKKVRKAYTITKSRESWTEPEHDKFLEALHLFDRDWKKIKAFVGSKTVIQIRSHAQKYFLKVQKNGTGEHLPPPRPKRKAAHPYPQKAPRTASTQSRPPGSFQSPTAILDPGYVQRPDSSPSTETTPRILPIGETAEQGNHDYPLRVLPDFAQVYNFIGSVFDPNVTGHLQKLKKMDPIDVETVLLLMRNLSVNLTSPGFEDHRRLLSFHEIETESVVANKTYG
ncbi:hypothetical protein K2173_028390 [Erythroxylum novogranatense]|uniref:Uncharacterized protein n=1 Tax=Erythroxylum novogranatense TaxID=1862640 RepID=A0AAV8U4H6_9ROSI|nr:hypothetical protein K2173_028390 [Erythroxylum novogranatense]